MYAHFSQFKQFLMDKIKCPFTFFSHCTSCFNIQNSKNSNYLCQASQKNNVEKSLLIDHCCLFTLTGMWESNSSALTVCFHVNLPYNSCHTNMWAMRPVHPLACVPVCFWVFPMLECGRAGKLFPVSEGFILWSNSCIVSSTQKERQEVCEDQTRSTPSVLHS